MNIINNRPIIIGIDHGYGNIKTANCCFKTGVASFDKEPTFKSNLLLFEGRYYLIGEEHKEFTADKMADSDYYILTLAAIGRELNIRKQTSARVHLAAGLPLTWVSEQKDAFKKYLLQKGSADFTFRGVEYHVDFAGADIFPQGFAAVADQLRDFRGVNMLADIGNGTMNVMYINDRRPQEKKCFTEKYGTHQCMLSVRENLLKLYGSAADVALQIEYAKQERPGSPGRSAFPGSKGHLLTTRKRMVVLPTAVVRSPRGMRPLRGPAGNDCGHSRCVWNKSARRPVPYASKNLPLAAFCCLRGTKDEGREMKDGGNRNWQFIIWRQKLSVGG